MKKMRFLALAVAMMSVLSFAGCNDFETKIEQTRCKHIMSEGEVTIEPTAEAAGEKLATCTLCGYTVTVSIPAMDVPSTDNEYESTTCTHIGVMEIAGKMPTCTTTGLSSAYMCSTCGGIVVKQEVIPAYGHTLRTIPMKEATCQEEGLTESVVCERCDVVLAGGEVLPVVECMDSDDDYLCDWCDVEFNKGEVLLNKIALADNVIETDLVDNAEYAVGTVIRIYRGKSIAPVGLYFDPTYDEIGFQVFPEMSNSIFMATTSYEGDFYYRITETYVDFYIGECTLISNNSSVAISGDSFTVYMQTNGNSTSLYKVITLAE